MKAVILTIVFTLSASAVYAQKSVKTTPTPEEICAEANQNVLAGTDVTCRVIDGRARFIKQDVEQHSEGFAPRTGYNPYLDPANWPTYYGGTGTGNAYTYGYYNPVPLARQIRKFNVEAQYGAFKIDGKLPNNGTRMIKVCVDGQFRDEATNIRSWTNPSAGLTAGNHTIELRDLGRMRAFRENVHVEPKAVTETFGGNRFKINLYLDRIEAQDSYPITGSCPGQ